MTNIIKGYIKLIFSKDVKVYKLKQHPSITNYDSIIVGYLKSSPWLLLNLMLLSKQIKKAQQQDKQQEMILETLLICSKSWKVWLLKT